MRPTLESEANLLRDAMRVAVPVEEPEKVAARREALLSVIERQVALAPGRVRHAESRRKLTQGLRWSAAAAALILAVGAGMFLQSQHRVHHETAASAVPSVSVTRVAHQGESLATSPGERQRLKLPGDTVVSVGERTGLRLIEAVPARQVMELDYGRVDVDVTPAEGKVARYVSVRTPHAVVEVKGTVFSVDVHGQAAAAERGSAGTVSASAVAHSATHDSVAARTGEPLETTVSVQRGVVVVHSASGDFTLLAGDSWSSAERLSGAMTSQGHAGAQAAAEASSRTKASHLSSSSSVATPSVAATRSAGSSQSAAATVQASPPSTLAEENELFEQAIVAAESGNNRRALSLCDEFLSSYPRSPLRATVFAKRAQLKSDELEPISP